MTREEAAIWFENRNKSAVLPGAREAFYKAIEALNQPEQKRGKWAETWHGYLLCSNCLHETYPTDANGNAVGLMDKNDTKPCYCPYCGAKMEAEE